MDFCSELKKINIEINEEQLNKFEIYYNFLVSYNENVNLTSITEKEEVYLKHFYDSITLLMAVEKGNLNLCDVGAGAGFPSVPCAIIDKDINVTIIDSLNKRINFLNQLVTKLEISNVCAIHSRAEEHASIKREYYDICTARAVARLNILVELCLPLVRVGGLFIAMKGFAGNEELEESLVAIKKLGGKVEKVIDFKLPDDQGDRQIIIIKKVKNTPLIYPRSYSVIKNKPIR